jgi:hypothetical protein
MDADTIKVTMQLVAGAMVLIGGALTFVNGRLNEAKTSEDRLNVIFWIKLCLTSMLAILPGAVMAFGYIPFGLLISTVVLGVFVSGYLKNVARGNASPFYTSINLILFSFYASGFAYMASIYFTQRAFMQQEQVIQQMIKLQEQMTERVIDLQSHLLPSPLPGNTR